MRRKTCALLSAKTSASLRRRICAVLRARTCALLRANTKEVAFGRLQKGVGLRPPPFVVSFVVALNKADVVALSTAHVLRLNKADVLALNKAHVLRLNNKICPVFRASTKDAAFGRLHKGGRPSAVPLCGFLCIGSEQSTCPSSQHSTCLASQQGRCLGSQKGACLGSQQ